MTGGTEEPILRRMWEVPMLVRRFSERVSTSVTVFFVLALTIFSAGQAHAQVTGATLFGTISDSSGAVIPGGQVSIKNRATGVVRDVTTDEAGFYSTPNLLSGNYDVTVSKPGFGTAMQSNITLGVGAQQRLNISLQIGQTNQIVEVTEVAPMVQVSTSIISSEVESTTVRELPLNGRDWASLATLSPGVNAIETQMPFESGAQRGNRGFGAQLTISGGRPTQNNYRLDGLSINDYGNGGPGSVIGVSLGVDAIQEFSVLTGNYSAEYGRTSGGVVNAISKSGTNAFHGDVYEFLRNEKLDARGRASLCRQRFRLTMLERASLQAEVPRRARARPTPHYWILLPTFALIIQSRNTWRSILTPTGRSTALKGSSPTPGYEVYGKISLPPGWITRSVIRTACSGSTCTRGPPTLNPTSLITSLSCLKPRAKS